MSLKIEHADKNQIKHTFGSLNVGDIFAYQHKRNNSDYPIFYYMKIQKQDSGLNSIRLSPGQFNEEVGTFVKFFDSAEIIPLNAVMKVSEK